jgi:hypothetical protein
MQGHFKQLSLKIPHRLIDAWVENRILYVPAAGSIKSVGPREWARTDEAFRHLALKAHLQLNQRGKGFGDVVKEARPDVSGIVLELQDTQEQLSGRNLRIADRAVEFHHEPGQGVFLDSVQRRVFLSGEPPDWVEKDALTSVPSVSTVKLVPVLIPNTNNSTSARITPGAVKG